MNSTNHTFKQIMISKQLFKMKSKIRGTPYFLKYFISNDLKNIKDSLIIAVIEEGTPKTSMITIITTFKPTV